MNELYDNPDGLFGALVAYGFGNQKGEGYEMDLLIFGMSLALLIAGSGRYSIDRLLIRSKAQPASAPVQPVHMTPVLQ